MSAVTIRGGSPLPVSLANHQALLDRLVPVTYSVVAGPPGSPETITMLEDLGRIRKDQKSCPA